MTIRQRVLLVVTLGPLLTALVCYFVDMRFITESYDAAVLQASRSVVSMAGAARSEMARKMHLEIIRPFDQIPPDKLVEAVPVITAINMVREKAADLGFSFRVPKEQPRNPHNAPTPEETRVLREMAARNLTEMVVKDADHIRYYQAIRLSKECLYCHGDAKGERDPVGGIKEGWKEGELHGAFEIISSLDGAKAEARQAAIITGGVTFGVIVLVVGLAWWRLQSDVLTPLGNLRVYAKAVAGGDLAATPRGTFVQELASVKNAIAAMVTALTRIAAVTSDAMRQSAIAIDELAGQIDGMRRLIDAMRRNNQGAALE